VKDSPALSISRALVRSEGGQAGPARSEPKEESTMAQYLLSLHRVEGETTESMTDEEQQQSWQRIHVVNEELRAAGAWVFGGALHGPETATVVRATEGDAVTTDGPFVESKEHLAGFYIIEADDLDAALTWASKTSAAVGKPIEVRPLRAGEA
jgi:hypothetical protein